MNDDPLISVVVPTFNAVGFIAATLDSILGQTWKSLDVIVVDDGSSDGTAEFVETRYPQVRLLRQANSGVCAARNLGLEHAVGDFICFVDHDDIWHREKLSRQVGEFKRNPGIGLVYSKFIWWRTGEDGVFPAPETILEEYPEGGLDEDFSGWIYHLLLLDCWVLTSTALIRRELMVDAGGFDVALPYSEDWDLWLRLARVCEFSKLKAGLVLYRQHPTQGSRKWRAIDYRTRLLEGAVARWGLSSPGGGSLPARQVWAKIGYYHASYGFDCLRANEMASARRSFWRAWRCDPMRLKYIGYIARGYLGWRPQW